MLMEMLTAFNNPRNIAPALIPHSTHRSIERILSNLIAIPLNCANIRRRGTLNILINTQIPLSTLV